MPQRPGPSPHFLLLLLLSGLGGCRACANDHPYVPPAAQVPVATSDDAAATVGSVEFEAGSLPEPALVAPPRATTWTVGGVTIEAGGQEIVLALVRDLDGDGKSDALAVVRPAVAERRPGTSTGELVFISGAEGAGAKTLASGPALGAQPSCTPIARLEKIGPRSAFAEIGSACPRGAGSRAVIVVRSSPPTPALALEALVVDPPRAPKLSVDVDAADRDKDGIDDVVLRMGIEGAPGAEAAPPLSARLAFFDRPAGPSRDPDEPEASLRPVSAQATARSSKPKDVASVPALVQQMRALYRAMCLEGGAPRVIKIHGGSAVSCGASKSLEDAAIAEVRAYATQGDALRAFAAAEAAQLAPATKTAGKTADLQRMLGEVAPVTELRDVRVIGSVADAAHDPPEWGPLAFEPTGKLLVRHGRSVVRVDPETGDEQPTDVPPWKDEVVSPDGKSRWIEAYHACEGVSLRATFAPVADGDMSDVLLPIAPRLGKACSGGRGEPAQTVPISWGARGLEALVAGQPVLFKNDLSLAAALPALLDEVPPPGSPRAHGAKAFALPTARGVLVRGRRGDRWGLARSVELEPYQDLRHCTASDDASWVACLRRRKVVVARLP